MRPPEHAFFGFWVDFGGFWPPLGKPNFVQNRSGAAPAKKNANFFPLFFDLKKNSDPGHPPGRGLRPKKEGVSQLLGVNFGAQEVSQTAKNDQKKATKTYSLFKSLLER